ncbi:MAG: hypothetical protein H0V70_08365 [Ktedonobacteraceae bacterium]|nr:hypothetical protein [Ktedonobacteraceae bacterium]
MEVSTYLHCPTCGQMDMVQKVSTVVEGGTTHGSTSSYGTAYGRGGSVGVSSYTSSTHQTEISRKLTFPEHSHALGIILGILSIIILAPATSCLFFETIVMAAVNSHTGVATAAQRTHEINLLWINGIVFLLFVLLGIAMIIFTIIKKNSEKPKRQQAQMIWHRLFYCHRDDTIFAPDDPTLRAPATHMRSILNY